MADLTTVERAALIVTDPHGNAVAPAGYAVIVNEPSDVIDVTNIEGTVYVIGKGPGTATISVNAGASSGELEVTVEAAPLSVTLGPVEPHP